MPSFRRLSAVAITLYITLSTTAAIAAQEVNVYSYRQPFLIEPMFEQFTRQTGIDVNVVFAKKGLVERLKREGSNSPADLVLTVDIGRLSDVAAAGLAQPIRTPTLDANIPAQYRHPEGLWYGLTTRARVIVAAKDRVKPGDIARYEDLADPRWKGRICTRSGKHVYTVALIASMIAHHGPDATENWLRGFKVNLARKPQGNDRAQARAVKEGECDLALMNTYYMGKMLQNEEQSAWAKAIYLVFPNQGDRGTHVNISGIVLTKSAPNRDNAVKLMEFLSDTTAQRMYAERNHEYPVKLGVLPSKLVESWGSFKADTLPLDTVAQHRKEAVKLADRVGFDS